MGGCKGDESTCSAEVFDPKIQTWNLYRILASNSGSL
ncbi:unnamed protein product [Brassica oleracea var. botrytis]